MILFFQVSARIVTITVKENNMEKFVCTVCGYVYYPAENDNVAFENLPEDYACPLCGVGKDMFEKE